MANRKKQAVKQRIATSGHSGKYLIKQKVNELRREKT